MCDVAYLIQVEQIERKALAQMALAPHLKEGEEIDTPETALAAFEAWLDEVPDAMSRPAEEVELLELLKVG